MDSHPDFADTDGVPERGAATPVVPFDAIAFDVDGVVADTMGKFIEIGRQEHGLADLHLAQITTYQLETCLGHIDATLLQEMLTKLLSDSVTRSLQPMPGVAAVLAEIGRRHAPLLFVTAREQAEAIGDWLCALLPAVPLEVVATGSFEAKQDVLLQHSKRFFVEDRLETCFLLQEIGIAPIVYRQPWNRRPHPFSEVGSWRQIAQMMNLKMDWPD